MKLNIGLVLASLSLIAAPCVAWEGRAVPVANHPQHGPSILLGLEQYGPHLLWSDFHTTGSHEGGDSAAARALTQQTGGQYSLSLKGTPWIRDSQSGDITHFVSVPFKQGSELYPHIQRPKTDIAWVPISSIISTTGDVAVPYARGTKQANIHRGILASLRSNLPQMLQQLGLTAPAVVSSSSTPLAAAPSAIEARVLPITEHPQLGTSVLLGLEQHGPHLLWSDFHKKPFVGQRIDDVASQALSQATGGAYTGFTLTGRPIPNPQSGDVTLFGSVPFKSGKDLYSSLAMPKQDIAWVPISAIMSTTGDVAVPYARGTKQANIHRGILATLRANLSQIMGAPTPLTATQAAVSSSTPLATTGVPRHANWFGIPGAIYFYQKSQPNYEFTNFYQGAPITIDGRQWKTSEHYFQAQKFADASGNPTNPTAYWAAFNAPDARGAFNAARQYQTSIKAGWRTGESFKAMLKALRAKFSQDARLKALLVGTGNAILVENAGANDDFWGAGANGSGANHLGRMLMHVRAELQGAPQTDYQP